MLFLWIFVYYIERKYCVSELKSKLTFLWIYSSKSKSNVYLYICPDLSDIYFSHPYSVFCNVRVTKTYHLECMYCEYNKTLISSNRKKNDFEQFSSNVVYFIGCYPLNISYSGVIGNPSLRSDNIVISLKVKLIKICFTDFD